MTAWNYSVLRTEASGTSADATLVYDLQQALGVWQRYILGSGTLVVELAIGSTAQGRVSSTPTSYLSVGTNGGITPSFRERDGI